MGLGVASILEKATASVSLAWPTPVHAGILTGNSVCAPSRVWPR